MNRTFDLLSTQWSNEGLRDRHVGRIFHDVDPRHGRSIKPQEDTTMRFNVLLWIVQGLLTLLFLFAGGMKLIVPIEAMAAQIHLPALLLRFIGVAEVLGAIGLILPGLLRIRPHLTPLAAAGLVIIMIGATVITAIGGGVAQSLPPVVVGLLAASVAYGRSRPGRTVVPSYVEAAAA
jgi:uncharacterized membrane protein YphA (DoxX/SURF4 family)